MPANSTIRVMGEPVRRNDLQRIVIDDPNGNLLVTIRLRDDTVLQVSGEEARTVLAELFHIDFRHSE